MLLFLSVELISASGTAGGVSQGTFRLVGIRQTFCRRAAFSENPWNGVRGAAMAAKAALWVYFDRASDLKKLITAHGAYIMAETIVSA
jgi:hypothetical protein